MSGAGGVVVVAGVRGAGQSRWCWAGAGVGSCVGVGAAGGDVGASVGVVDAGGVGSRRCRIR